MMNQRLVRTRLLPGLEPEGGFFSGDRSVTGASVDIVISGTFCNLCLHAIQGLRIKVKRDRRTA
jgi:hypothetical protein